MFVLHIELNVKPGKQEELETAYLKKFRPAISTQQGFIAAELLHPNDDFSAYCLSLAFDQQSSQQQWVSTDAHQEVWPTLENQCMQFSLKRYNTV